MMIQRADDDRTNNNASSNDNSQRDSIANDDDDDNIFTESISNLSSSLKSFTIGLQNDVQDISYNLQSCSYPENAKNADENYDNKQQNQKVNENTSLTFLTEQTTRLSTIQANLLHLTDRTLLEHHDTAGDTNMNNDKCTLLDVAENCRTLHSHHAKVLLSLEKKLRLDYGFTSPKQQQRNEEYPTNENEDSTTHCEEEEELDENNSSSSLDQQQYNTTQNDLERNVIVTPSYLIGQPLNRLSEEEFESDVSCGISPTRHSTSGGSVSTTTPHGTSSGGGSDGVSPHQMLFTSPTETTTNGYKKDSYTTNTTIQEQQNQNVEEEDGNSNHQTRDMEEVPSDEDIKYTPSTPVTPSLASLKLSETTTYVLEKSLTSHHDYSDEKKNNHGFTSHLIMNDNDNGGEETNSSPIIQNYINNNEDGIILDNDGNYENGSELLKEDEDEDEGQKILFEEDENDSIHNLENNNNNSTSNSNSNKSSESEYFGSNDIQNHENPSSSSSIDVADDSESQKCMELLDKLNLSHTSGGVDDSTLLLEESNTSLLGMTQEEEEQDMSMASTIISERKKQLMNGMHIDSRLSEEEEEEEEIDERQEMDCTEVKEELINSDSCEIVDDNDENIIEKETSLEPSIMDDQETNDVIPPTTAETALDSNVNTNTLDNDEEGKYNSQIFSDLNHNHNNGKEVDDDCGLGHSPSDRMDVTPILDRFQVQVMNGGADCKVTPIEEKVIQSIQSPILKQKSPVTATPRFGKNVMMESPERERISSSPISNQKEFDVSTTPDQNHDESFSTVENVDVGVKQQPDGQSHGGDDAEVFKRENTSLLEEDNVNEPAVKNTPTLNHDGVAATDSIPALADDSVDVDEVTPEKSTETMVDDSIDVDEVTPEKSTETIVRDEVSVVDSPLDCSGESEGAFARTPHAAAWIAKHMSEDKDRLLKVLSGERAIQPLLPRDIFEREDESVAVTRNIDDDFANEVEEDPVDPQTNKEEFTTFIQKLNLEEYDAAPRVVKMQVSFDEVNQAAGILNQWLNDQRLNTEASSIAITEAEASKILEQTFTSRKGRSIMMSFCHFRRMVMKLSSSKETGKQFVIPFEGL